MLYWLKFVKTGINANEKINPDKVNEKNLEELGDSVMEVMIGNHAEHERMDQMMGGDGSPGLKLCMLHQRTDICQCAC